MNPESRMNLRLLSIAFLLGLLSACASMPPPQVQAVPEGAPPAQGFSSPMGGMQR